MTANLISLNSEYKLSRVTAAEVQAAADLVTEAFGSESEGHLVYLELSELFERYGAPSLAVETDHFVTAEYWFLFREGNPTPIGVSGLYRFAEMNPKLCGLGWFGIRLQYRRQGLGRLLLKSTMQLAVRYGFKRMMIETSPYLKAAIDLYVSEGFEANGRVPHYYGENSDLSLYSRSLADIPPL